jgi:hypothetical protein
MSGDSAEVSLRRKKKIKRYNLADAIDTPTEKLRKTTGADGTAREDMRTTEGLHSLVTDTEDATKTLSSLSCARMEGSARPVDDQKDVFPTVLPKFGQSSLARQKRGLRARRLTSISCYQKSTKNGAVCLLALLVVSRRGRSTLAHYAIYDAEPSFQICLIIT